MMYLTNLCVSVFFVFSSVYADIHLSKRSLFDKDLYESVLKPEICERQLEIIHANGQQMYFYDAGVRGPRGILRGNLADWGNYHQCLNIYEDLHAEEIILPVEGKYCSVRVPLQQDISDLTPIISHGNVTNLVYMLRNGERDANLYRDMKEEFLKAAGFNDNTFSQIDLGASLALTLGICIPKACSTNQTFNFVLNGHVLNYTDNFCRLPDDKPFSNADYVAISLFTFIGLLIALSTSYDLYQEHYHKNGRKEMNTLWCSFSIYTNTRRLLTFNNSPEAINCIDGIRAISMLWVIIGHSFVITAMALENPLDAYEWIKSFESFWIISTPIVVDTFFMMSGLLVVYTTLGTLTRKTFIKNLHLFYLLRYLRMFPLLAAAVLLQASLFHHLSDGPYWQSMASQVQQCRDNWWSALLYVQNYVNPTKVCISTTWYLAVDMQLYWMSPFLLVWLLDRRRHIAWLALFTVVVVSLLCASIYVFLKNFPPTIVSPRRTSELVNYFKHYYANTLTRAPVFFVGMSFGYILHIYRGKKVKLAPELVVLCWASATALSSFAIFIVHPITKPDYQNQILDNFLNAFMRPLWAAGLGWCIFACVHGYGGPVNWFLSLSLWKLPARLSFAMYLLHYPIMILIVSSMIRPLYFTASNVVYRFMADLVLTVIASIILTLAVDSPFSTLQKIIFGKARTSCQPPSQEVTLNKDVTEEIG